MQHLLFRYLIPGIFLLIPSYICIFTLGKSNEDTKSLIALTTAIVVPLGYIFFQVYRIFWQNVHLGYETSTFVNIIRDNLKIFIIPNKSKVFIDFRKIMPSIGIRWFTFSEFKEVFNPFAKNNKKDMFYLHFLEPVSDVILFSQSSYDYARSISTVRYSAGVSMIALIAGSVIALFLKYIIVDNYNSIRTYDNPAFWLSLLLAILLLIIKLLVVRRNLADSEYNARLLLLTIINIDSRIVSEEDMEKEISKEDIGIKIPQELDCIRNLSQTKSSKIAAFDMDDTLLIGDVGDAVLAELIIEKKLSPEIWPEYQIKFGKNRDDAYRFAVMSMAGLTINDVLLATRNVLNSKKEKLIIPNCQTEILIPKPFIPLQSLIGYLQNEKYDIYVVTATNIWTARLIATKYFNIEEQNVIGMSTKLSEEKKITDILLKPDPCGDGKLKVLQQKIGEQQPIIAAGNSESDFALLKSVKEQGVVIWVSKDDTENQKIIDMVKESTKVVFLNQQM